MRNNLKAIRKQKTNLTQETAATALGMKLETYRKWEQGKVNLSSAQLAMLSKFYGCTIDEICATDLNSAQAAISRDALFQEELADLNACYANMSDDARDALVAIAHDLLELFPRG